MESKKCPVCGSVNLTNEHLMREYLEMNKASFDRMFGRNAEEARIAIADELIWRGIDEIPNIFGPIPVRN